MSSNADIHKTDQLDVDTGNRIITVPRPNRWHEAPGKVGAGHPGHGEYSAGFRMAFGTLQSGTYAIINAQSDRTVTLSSNERGANLTGERSIEHHGDPTLKWAVARSANDTYTITHDEFKLCACPKSPVDGLTAETDEGSPVVAKDINTVQWYIREGRRPGYYLLYASAASGLYWKMDSNNTVILATIDAGLDNEIGSEYMWNFTPLGGDATPIFDFKFRLNCSVDSRSSSCVECPLDIDLRQDFTLLGWVLCENRTTNWHSILSFESPQVPSSLFTVALPPASKPPLLNLAYMTGVQVDRIVGGLHGNMEVPIQNWFHLAVVFKAGDLTTGAFKIYINGENDAILNVQERIYRAKDIHAVIGSRKFMNGPASQWIGCIENVRIYQAAMSDDKINTHMAEGTLTRVRVLMPPKNNYCFADPFAVVETESSGRNSVAGI
ncbi:hypothetical protein BJ138DRAFT_1168394 [Hygrophoropsis aurantiaca]|uniref:Uncharacterized protein n=1 Tax=Hygrophoropsis aurantiaca TaxID=72124 RepID=A0ACB7ZR17_9AGAM|nr:hypothetical protein BJ138DRAFT_1168394 [Hygrophoropsis aurantiaca]